jgi:TATA-binding protein-associated factor Taf7
MAKTLFPDEHHALSASLDPTSRCLPPTTATSGHNDLAQSAPSQSTPAMLQSHVKFYNNLDPALMSAGDLHLGVGDTGSQSSEASADNNNDNGSHADDDEEDEEEGEEDDVKDQEVRWGAAHGRCTVHPGK